jgi:hypothetical protein
MGRKASVGTAIAGVLVACAGWLTATAGAQELNKNINTSNKEI